MEDFNGPTPGGPNTFGSETFSIAENKAYYCVKNQFSEQDNYKIAQQNIKIFKYSM